MPDLTECPLRIQLILSILSGKPIKVRKIRSDEEEPGLKGIINPKNHNLQKIL